MAASSLSTIAQLICYETLPVNFAKLIREVDAMLEPLVEAPFKISWDCDAVATFDLPGTRVLLAWSDHPGQSLSGILTLSVGPSPVLGKAVMRPDHAALSSHLAKNLQEQTRASGILWHQFACTMSADWVELLIEALPDLADQSLPSTDQPLVPQRLVPQRYAPQRLAPRKAGVPNHHQPAPTSEVSFVPTLTFQTTHSPADRNQPYDADMCQVREALKENTTARTGRPMRLMVHAINATFTLVLLPLGVIALAQAALAGS